MKKILLILALLLLFPLSAVYGGEATMVNFTWNPNSESDLAGYKLYYGRASGSYDYMVKMPVRTEFPLVLESGTVYYLALKAYDISGNDSPFSGELSYTVPQPDIIAPIAPTIINIPDGSSVIINIP